MNKSVLLVIVAAFVASASAHDEYMGKCPEFPSMPEFDWTEFREGRWYAIEKFGTTQSKCLTYDFGEDENGFRFIEQHSAIKGLSRFSVDNKYKYKGRLTAPYRADPGRMVVRFPLSNNDLVN